MGIKNRLRRAVFHLSVFFATFSASERARADLQAISGGISVPTAMGFNYQTLSNSIGYLADAWTSVPALSSYYMQLHFTVAYDPFTVRNQTGMNVGVLQGFAGVQFMEPKDYLKSITPFFSFQIGAAYDWLNLANVTALTSDNSLAFALQVSPGVDVPITGALGAVLQMPIKAFFFKTSLVTWSPSLSVRLSL